jgi:hypothetical protein
MFELRLEYRKTATGLPCLRLSYKIRFALLLLALVLGSSMFLLLEADSLGMAMAGLCLLGAMYDERWQYVPHKQCFTHRRGLPFLHYSKHYPLARIKTLELRVPETNGHRLTWDAHHTITLTLHHFDGPPVLMERHFYRRHDTLPKAARAFSSYLQY